jgi:hypothetical protein
VSPGRKHLCTHNPHGHHHALTHGKIIQQKTSLKLIPASTPHLNLLAPRHALQLLRPSNRLQPARALRRIQLQVRLGPIEPIQSIQHADLESLVVAESRRLAPHGGAAVAAEKGLDRLARVRLFLPRLGLAGRDLEALAGDHDVGAVGGAGDFLAVGAVAEGLLVGGGGGGVRNSVVLLGWLGQLYYTTRHCRRIVIHTLADGSPV